MYSMGQQPISMMGTGYGGGEGGFGGMGLMGLLLAFALLGRNGRGGLFGGGEGGGEGAAGAAVVNQVGNIEGRLSDIQSQISSNAISAQIDSLPGKTASATNSILCPELCGIKSTLGHLPTTENLFTAFAATNANINSVDRNIERGFNASNQLVTNSQFILAQQAANNYAATASQIDNKFCGLSHEIERNNCATNANITAQGEATRTLIRDINTENITRELREALAFERAKTASLEQNALIAGSNNTLQQGLVNINQSFTQAINAHKDVMNGRLDRITNIILQNGATNTAGQTAGPLSPISA